MTLLDSITLSLIVTATLGAWTFVILYGVLAPWYRSPAGRHMLTFTLGLAALGSMSLLRRVVDWAYYDLTITLIYGLLTWEVWHRVILFLTAGRDADNP